MNSPNNHSKAAEAATPERTKKAHRPKDEAVESPDKALARRIRARLNKEELRKKTTLGLYSLKVKDGFFGIPFCAVSDHFALLAQKQILPLSDCYKVGIICLVDGKVSPVKPYVVLDKGVENA